jgi:hypothetical protein
MPREKTLLLLQEALVLVRGDTEQLVERLVSICRDEGEPHSAEQVVALGFLTCVRALREAALLEEIAIREETQHVAMLIGVT